MRLLTLLAIVYFGNSQLFGQCLTDFSKLLPETSIDYTVDFGRSLSMYEEFLAVGVPNSDSVGRITGLVYIYKKDGTKWIKNAAITPELPIDGLQFGWSVKITEDYLFVGAFSQRGSVYVFRKNGVDWSNFSELAIWKVPGAQIFGTWDNNPIGVTIDQNTVAITDIWHQDNSFPEGSTGAIYLYQKTINEEWSSSIEPLRIPPPEVEVDDFGGGGVLFQGNRMATFTRFAPTANGRIYVYKDEIGAFDNPMLEAKLSAGDLTFSYGFGSNNFAFTQDGIFLMASVDVSTENPKWEVAFFEQPQSGAWSDGYLTCHFDPDVDTDTTNWEPTLFASSGNDLIISSRNLNAKGTLTRLQKGVNGWCSPIRETIDENLPDPSTPQRYGLRLAANNNSDAVLGFVSNPNTGITQVALMTFAKAGNEWEPNYLFTLKKSTAGHYFGRKVLGMGDNLFVSAPYDGTVKAKAGAVYIYTKNGSFWSKSGKILPPAGGKYDDVFASDMATNGDYLVVAALGHSPNGKFFVYKKQSDWNNPTLVQEINLASDGLTVHISGDYMAMSQEWLVMPYMDSPSSPSSIYLALYKFNGSSFQFAQSLYVRPTDFFARSSTVPVSIEGNLIVAGSTIVELNDTGIWEIKYQLSPSDPEPMRIAPDFSHWISNGSRFGASNWISNGTIFISAPTKDYEGIWDVGAVYVYAKLPEEAWSSRTESAKIVPQYKEPSGLFGYSIAAFQNTLIVGSPLNDFDKNGVPINKPGKASVFQAKDYYWKETSWLADFTGDSFVKDYFGLAVHVDETDFFMGATIEDLETGKISGSVYIVPTPPIVKLVPPVCLSENTFTLLGYPFQGTWNGAGIVDAEQGIFNPSIAGIGVHTLTYQTANCANQGILQVEVKANPIITLPEAKEYLVCKNTNPIAITIEIPSQPDVNYLWYYRADNSGVFQYQDETTSDFVATKRGEYQVKATNGVCSSFSPIITIKDENIELQLDVPSPSCNASTDNVPLNATPAGGIWTGNGVSNNTFIPFNKPAGVYPLTYTYTSGIGCPYTKAVTAQVVSPFIPALEKSGDVCINGTATVSLTSTPIMPTTIQWYKKELNETNYYTVQDGVNSIEIDRNGSIKVITETIYCSSKEATMDINDSFTISISPNEPSLTLCQDEETNLTIASSYAGGTIEWNFYENDTEDATIINTADFQIKPDQTGYYFATVYLGNCQTLSSIKHVTVQPPDTVFIPNVFTPNGDRKNDTFKILTNFESPAIEIFNRSGNQVYFSSKSSEWDGGNSPSGVYYWIASIPNCKGEKVIYKGIVHLIR
jgi:gliding motility-associated-like protein